VFSLRKAESVLVMKAGIYGKMPNTKVLQQAGKSARKDF
jgi:hypothetical protein